MENEEVRVIIEGLNRRLDKIESLSMIGAKEILTTEEAAAFTGLSKGSLYVYVSKGEIPHYKKGKRVFFRKNELEDWIMSESEIDREAECYCKSRKASFV